MWWSFFSWSRSPLSGTLKATTGRTHKLAERIARRYCHEYVGTEHLLLALLLPPANPATDLLERCGVVPDEVARTTERIILDGPGPVPWGRLSQTPAARRALEAARQEAVKATSMPGAVAVLIGLAHERGGLAGQVLFNLGAGEEALRAAVGLAQREGRPG